MRASSDASPRKPCARSGPVPAASRPEELGLAAFRTSPGPGEPSDIEADCRFLCQEIKVLLAGPLPGTSV